MSKPWFDLRFVVWFNGVYIMTCVCGFVREGMTCVCGFVREGMTCVCGFVREGMTCVCGFVREGMTCVCGFVREGMRVHIIKSPKHGIRRLLSGLPLKHNLCECQVLIDSVNK